MQEPRLGLASATGAEGRQLGMFGDRDREQIRQITVISALDQLRHRLLGA